MELDVSFMSVDHWNTGTKQVTVKELAVLPGLSSQIPQVILTRQSIRCSVPSAVKYSHEKSTNIHWDMRHTSIVKLS